MQLLIGPLKEEFSWAQLEVCVIIVSFITDVCKILFTSVQRGWVSEKWNVAMLIMLGWFVVAEVQNGGLIKLYVKASVDSITSPEKYFASQLVQQLNTQRTKPHSEPTDKHQNVLYTLLLSCAEEKISASHPEFQIFHCSVSQWAFNLQVLWLFHLCSPRFKS